MTQRQLVISREQVGGAVKEGACGASLARVMGIAFSLATIVAKKAVTLRLV
jgi:hypothetical protein